MSGKKPLTYNQRVAVTMLIIAGFVVTGCAIFAGFCWLLSSYPWITLPTLCVILALWGLFAAARSYVNEEWSDDL